MTAAALAFLVLTFAGFGRAVHPPFPRAKVEAVTLRDPTVARFLRTTHWTRLRIAPLDRQRWRVTVQDGEYSILDATVGPTGSVEYVTAHPSGVHPPGSVQVWARPVLILLTLVFVAALAVVPLRSVRNLDALVLGGGVLASLIFDDERFVRAQVFAGVATVLYIAARAAVVALRPPTTTEQRRPLWREMTRPALAGLIVMTTLVTITSTGVSDVAIAGLAGATDIVHGVLPYGHVTADVVHGDTYPLLTYVVFVPVAALWPVHDSFDNMDPALWVNAVALLTVAGALFEVARRLAGRDGAIRTVIAWLAFPAVVLAASGGGNDVPAAAFVALSLLWWQRAALATLALTIVAWVKIVPGVVLLLRVPQERGRSLRTCIVVVAGVSAVVVLGLVALGGLHGPGKMVDALRFQVERGSYHSLWKQLGWPLGQRVFEALTIGFAAASAWLVATRPELGRDLVRVAALGAANVLLLQLSGNYWTEAYLPWAMPLVLIGLFPPLIWASGKTNRAARPRSRRRALTAP